VTAKDNDTGSGTADTFAAEAADFLGQKIDAPPAVVLVLGSGMGDLADRVEHGVSIPYAGIPHFPSTTVPGHTGRLVIGKLGGRRVLVVQGRFHLYEGHPIDKVVLPVNVAARLGAQCLFVTNAGGGIRKGFHPGTLMWITDHINWTGAPTRRPTFPGERTADALESLARGSGACYDAAWTDRAANCADALGIPTERGTYLWTRGPSYETKAEIRAFRKLGADVVGMSTVPEVVAARRAGMAVIGLSTVTNLAAGLGGGSLDHSEVIETGRSVRHALERITAAVIETAPI